MSSVPDAIQRLIVEGELQVVTTESLGETRGRVVFVDKSGNTFGSFRVFGQYPFARLILDSAGLSSGVSFRTASNQGSIADGGQGAAYAAEVGTTGMAAIKLNLAPQQRNPPVVTERGDVLLDVSRNGTYEATNLYNSIANFNQSTFKENEDVYISTGKAFSTLACLGLNTAYSSITTTDRPFLGVATSPYTRPTKAITFDLQNNILGSDATALAVNMNGLVGIPQNLYVGHNMEAGFKYASFDRSSTNYMILPASNLTFTTTGTTFIAVVAFSGTPGNNERIFEYATGTSGNNSFSIGRSGTGTGIQCSVYNATTQVGIIDNVGTIVQDQWTIISAVYTNTSTTLDLYQDGIKIGTVVCSGAVTDKSCTTSGSYMGRSTFTANAYTTMNLAGLFVFNTKLTSTQISGVTVSNFDVKASSYNPTYSFVGSRLRFQNNEKITSWLGATQSTVARQPTAKVLGLQYGSSGLNIQGNVDVTGNYLVNGVPIGGTVDLSPLTLDKPNNRVGLNNTNPQKTFDVVGDAGFTGIIEADGMAIRDQGLLVGSKCILDSVDVINDLTCSTIIGSPKYAVGTSLFTSGGGSPETIVDAGQGSLFLRTDGSPATTMYIKTSDSDATGWIPINPAGGIVPADLLPITLDKTNNRVGIDQTTPLAPLHVNGNIVGGWGPNAVAIGTDAGWAGGSLIKQGTNSVAIGNAAGAMNQGAAAIAVGYASGSQEQSTGAVAIGNTAGNVSQGARAIAIGQNAGQNGQGASALAFGFSAGTTNQHANSIILNASGSAVNSDGTSRFYVKPIRQNTASTTVLGYDSTSGEISYRPASSWQSVLLAGYSAFSIPANSWTQYTPTSTTLEPGTYMFTAHVSLTSTGGSQYYDLQILRDPALPTQSSIARRSLSGQGSPYWDVFTVCYQSTQSFVVAPYFFCRDSAVTMDGGAVEQKARLRYQRIS